MRVPHFGDRSKPDNRWAFLILALSAGALAQAGSSASRPKALEEVVVTAQKRAQNIQDVPVSVSSLSGDSLKELNMENMNDLSKITPNLKIVADGIFNTISIRGLGSGANNGFEQSVGTFIDDVYFNSTARLLSAMYDIDRIEVLRGPQGTLFGRNTIAGAVAVHTGRVHDEGELIVDSTIGDYDWNKHTVVYNTPIVEGKLGMRVAAHYFDREGHVYDRKFERDSGSTNNRSARVKMRYDFLDDASFTLTYQNLATKLRGQGDQYHNMPQEWINFFRDQGYDEQIEGDLDDYEHSTDYLSGGDIDFEDLIGHLDFRLWEHDFSAVMALTDAERVGGLDADFGPSPAVLAYGAGDSEQKSFELRMMSDPGTLEYIAGVYYFELDRTDLTDTFVSPVILARAVAGGSFVSLPGVGNAIGVAGNLADNIASGDAADQDRKRNIFRQMGESYAAYGQLTWNFAPAWSLIGGARYSIDYKDLDFRLQLTSADGSDGSVTWEQVLGAEEFHVTPSRTDESFTPKLSLTHYLTENVNLYFTYAKGFKAGGYNASAQTNNKLEFEAEESTTYELGAKGDYFGGIARLNVALFHTEFEDLQVSTFDGTDYIVDNAAEATSKGVEVEGTVLLPWGFMLNGNYARLDATYDSFPFGPCQTQHRSEEPTGSPEFCDISGATLANAPEEQYTISLNYFNTLWDWPVDFVAGVDYYWQDDVFLQTDLDPEDAQASYSLWNARMGIRADNELWSFTVFVRNVEDEVVLTSSNDVPLFSGAHSGSVELPRTVTANFKLHFDGL